MWVGGAIYQRIVVCVAFAEGVARALPTSLAVEGCAEGGAEGEGVVGQGVGDGVFHGSAFGRGALADGSAMSVA